MIYIAGPFFNEEQINVIRRIEKSCGKFGLNFFSPRHEGVIVDMTPQQRSDPNILKTIYNSNIEAIKKSTCIIAVIDGKDIGTIFEIGYAAALGKKIITFTDLNYGVNVMLSQCVFAHTDTTDDAAKACIPNSSFKRSPLNTNT